MSRSREALRLASGKLRHYCHLDHLAQAPAIIILCKAAEPPPKQEKDEKMDLLNLPSLQQVPLGQVLLNFCIAAILGFVLRWHYVRFGKTLSNREGFAAVFPFIVITTMLIITIVKSSLALSLGLVGALSIIRFRTPIKEPEELAYLFVAIAIGIGLGANFVAATVVVVLLMLLLMARFSNIRASRTQQHLYLSIDTPNQPGGERFVEALTDAISGHVSFCDLHRVDWRGENAQVTYFIDINATAGVTALLSAIRSLAPEAEITLLDQKRIPGV